MQAGQYYVGDLCYVLGDRWDEVCDLIIDGHKCLDGVFTLKDGTQFGIFSTAHGDGFYTDQEGREYPVDSGSIGCVLVSSITPGELEKAGGNLIDFEWNFTPYESDGLIEIGHISIMTDYENNDDEEQDYWMGEEDDE
jgi:hypothetical protein